MRENIKKGNSDTRAVIFCRFVKKKHDELSNICEIEKYKIPGC